MPSTQIDRIDGISTSTAVKAPVKCTTSVAITLYGEQTIVSADDGNVAVVAGDRVLVNAQGGDSAHVDNGIYDVSETEWRRSPDFDGPRDAREGTRVYTQSGSIWRLLTEDVVQIGTSLILFQRSDDTQLRLDLANPDNGYGSSMIAFRQSGTDAADQTVQEKTRERVSILDFITDPTIRAGIITNTSNVDVTSYVEAACAYLTTRSGGDLIAPIGVYRVRDCEIPANINLIGHGRNTHFRFFPSGNDAADAASWTIKSTGSKGGIFNCSIEGYRTGSSTVSIGNGLLLVPSSDGLVRSVENVWIEGFAGYKASPVGGTYGVNSNYARADITDDAGNHLLTGGNGIKVDTVGSSKWELFVNNLRVMKCDGIGADWGSCTDSKFDNIWIGSCVFHGWLMDKSNRNCQGSNIKVYRCMTLNPNDPFEEAIDHIIPHQSTVAADIGAVVLTGENHFFTNFESQENGSHGFKLGTYGACLSSSYLELLADGNGGYDADASAPTQAAYRRYGVFAYNFYGLRGKITANDFRSKVALGRQTRGFHVLSSAQTYGLSALRQGDWYKIANTSGGADFTPLQVGYASPSNAVGTQFQARALYGNSLSATFGTGWLTQTNDLVNLELMILNQYEQDQGTGVGYSLTGLGSRYSIVINNTLRLTGESSYAAANTDIVYQSFVGTETYPRYKREAGGKQYWGAGATDVDVVLDRIAAGVWGTTSAYSLRSGSGAWNGGHLTMGTYHIWIDGTGDLRIKSSAPTSDTDGTVVGTQS